MRKWLWAQLLILGLGAGGVTACGGGPGMAAQHERLYQAMFRLQRVNRDGVTAPRAPAGLDSQEAAIISNSFLRSLAPSGSATGEPPVLLLAPGQQPQRKNGY